MSLDTLHIEAGVPHYQAKLQKSMNRYFKAMTPEMPVTRNNVSISTSSSGFKGLHDKHILTFSSSSSSLMMGYIGPTEWARKMAMTLPVSRKTHPIPRRSHSIWKLNFPNSLGHGRQFKAGY